MKQHPPLRGGIVADDLTSATDGAAPFLARGHAPLIARQTHGTAHRAIVSVDTNSRALGVVEAEAATAAAVSALAQARWLFKTIDSALRGHVRAEIAAAFRASQRSRMVIAPAFPAAGRLTLGGVQRVCGIPVSDSSYGRDPVHPARTSRIADLLDPSLGLPVVLARQGGDVSAPILILDADSQEALNRQVAAIPDPESVLWVGSPGLAIALAGLLPSEPAARAQAEKAAARVLIVAGSANPVTAAQCEALRAGDIPVVAELAEAPAGARVICLRAPLQRQADPAAVLESLAGAAAGALVRPGFDAVIATGGETMAAILGRIDIHHFTLTGELEPGFPVGRAARPDGTPLTLAMKAGGFGSPATLLEAAHALTNHRISRKVLTDDHS